MREYDLEILCCPNSHRSLQIDTVGNKNYLIDKENYVKYPIKDEISIFLNANELPAKSKKYLKLFELLSPIYGLIIWFICLYKSKGGAEDLIREEIAKQLNIQDYELNILEVAIGTGSNMKYLNKKAKYFGIDISFRMLKKCSRNMKKWNMNSELACGVADKLPYKDNKFDVVFCINGLMYFPEIKKSISEIIRVAKPEGRVILINKKSWEDADRLSKYLSQEMKIMNECNFFDNKLYKVEIERN